jgi:hypothetical protein
MRKTIFKIGIALAVAGSVLLTGCAQQTQHTASAKVGSAADSSIIDEPGYYENKSFGFSIKYPQNVFTERHELLSGEVLSVEGPQVVPAFVLGFDDIKAGVALEDIGAEIVKIMKQAYPKAKRLKIIEDKMIKLEGDVDANYILMKWRYQGGIPLLSAFVTVYKDGKELQTAVTSTPGQPPVEQLTKWATGLIVSP